MTKLSRDALYSMSSISEKVTNGVINYFNAYN